MDSRSYGFGIIVCGMIAKWHAAAIALMASAVLVGVYDTSEVSRCELSRAYATKSFESLDLMLSCRDIKSSAYVSLMASMKRLQFKQLYWGIFSSSRSLWRSIFTKPIISLMRAMPMETKSPLFHSFDTDLVSQNRRAQSPRVSLEHWSWVISI